MKYYVMTGSQCQKNGGWNDADLSCEASSPKEARAIFDSIFQKPDSYQIVLKTITEFEDIHHIGGLEPE